MAITYFTYEDFTMVYSNRGISQNEINSYWTMYGSNRVNESLGHIYSLPFSSNNLTAKTLAIDFAQVGILLRSTPTRGKDETNWLQADIDKRISAITSGGAYMIDETGSVIKPDVENGASTAWSTTENYKPTFDMRNSMHQKIDRDRLLDDWDEV